MAGPISYSEWLRRQDSGVPLQPMFFCGPESLLRDHAVSRLKERLFGDDLAAARNGHERFYGGETPLSQVTSSVASTSLFASARLVTLADAERCGRAGSADRMELLEHLKSREGGTVFVATSGLAVRDLERKNEFSRALLGACEVVETVHPSPAGAMRWLLDEARRRGLRLQADAGEVLLSRIGTDLQELSRELEKLELWAGAGQEIGEREIVELVRQGHLGTGWEYCEAVVAGKGEEALRLWEAVRRSEPVLRTQWLLQRQIRQRLARSGSPVEELRLGQVLLKTYGLEWGIKSGRIPSGQDGAAMEIVAAAAGQRQGARGRKR